MFSKILDVLSKIVLWLLVVLLLVIIFVLIEASYIFPIVNFFTWIFIGFALSIGASIGYKCVTAFVKFSKWAFNVGTVKWKYKFDK